ncbi:NADH-quinone oxidoreductase subunit C [Bacillus sp. V5-8f]|uniref:NADH-quinone oxidoreductase subunit C n=1 Tax=Bacillus sp. V5-8f TaxID=2053044 RepID=UPI000C763DA7|nr:NADH-quinone oxidoreductase subunit C [Bacillus sp. V5-8f]PLT35860.1 NADH-quinone oxidoreductase subunit C [Bacillus sp. V5-8f]
MDGEKSLEELKKAAAAKAKAAALARKLAKEQGSEVDSEPAEKEDLAKKKAAAAAAKAAALAKKQAKERGSEVDSEPAEKEDLAKKKAAAAAAKAAALARKQATEQKAATSSQPAGGEDLEKKKAIAAAKAKTAALAKIKGNLDAEDPEKAKAKAIAAAKAKAAAAARAKVASASKVEEELTTEAIPSPNQHFLDKYVKVIDSHLGKDVLEDSYINKLSKDVPTLVAKQDTYRKVAELLKRNEQLSFHYLSELHGSDFETHMEIYVHLYSFTNRQSVALKVKINRDDPEIPSLVPLWEGANWPECEAYDLLGIKFLGHPDLKRILLGEEWIGHPLRKDYEPYDVEV